MPHFTGLLGLMCILLASSTHPCQCARSGLSFRAGVATRGRTLHQSNGLPATSTSAVGNSTFGTTTSSRDTSAVGRSTAVGPTANGTAVAPTPSRNNTLTPSAKNGTVTSGSNGTSNNTIDGTLVVTRTIILLPLNISPSPKGSMAPRSGTTMAPRSGTIMAPTRSAATMAPRSGNTTGQVTGK
eukprot:jgi/Chrzof1/5087/Cz15g10370.t1